MADGVTCARCESSWVGVKTGHPWRYPTRLCDRCREPNTDGLMAEMARAKARGADILETFAERAAEYPWDVTAAFFERRKRELDEWEYACRDARLDDIQADYQAGKRIRTRRRRSDELRWRTK